MCLGVPGCVLSVRGKIAIVDFWGAKKSVRLDDIAEPIVPGDYIIDHQGYAVRKIDMDAVAETLGMYEIILSEAGCDPIATEVVAELECGEEIDVEAGELVLA
jgi:hydrogenase expression/formation protein HypC